MGAGLLGELTRAEAERACNRETDRQGRGETHGEQETEMERPKRKTQGHTHRGRELRTQGDVQRERQGKERRRGGEAQIEKTRYRRSQRDKFRAGSGREGESHKETEKKGENWEKQASTDGNPQEQNGERRPTGLVENSLLRRSQTAQIRRPGPPSPPPLTGVGGGCGSGHLVRLERGLLSQFPNSSVSSHPHADNGTSDRFLWARHCCMKVLYLHTLTQRGIVMPILHTRKPWQREAKLSSFSKWQQPNTRALNYVKSLCSEKTQDWKGGDLYYGGGFP